MGCNEARGWIRFPVVFMDEEIRKHLEDEYDVNFKDGQLVFEEEDRDIYVENGLFSFSGEVCYGELQDLERMLVTKGIPFDRISFADFQSSPRKRIFRPRPYDLDHVYPLDADSENVVVSVDEILLRLERSSGPIAQETIIELRAYLDEKFPPYEPIEHFVPELIEERVNLKAAVEGIRTVDFSRFPGLYDMIPWEALEAAAGIE